MDNVNYSKFEKRELITGYVEKVTKGIEELEKRFSAYQEEINADLVTIEKDKMAQEANKNISIFQKYITYAAREKMVLIKLESTLEIYEGELSDYYRFHWDKSTKLTESAISKYVYAHDVFSILNKLIKLQKTVIGFLDNIVLNLNNRNYTIKNIIEVRKMELGLT